MANGIKVLPTKKTGATATVITSNTVIGIVGSASLTDIDEDVKALYTDESQAKLLYFSDAEKALEVFKNQKGTIREDLRDIQKQNVKSPIVISLVELLPMHEDKSATDFYEDEEFKTKIVLAIDNLKKARTIFGQKIRIIVAGWFSADTTVRDSLESFATGTKSIAIVDLNLNVVSTAITALQSLGSMRTLVFPFFRKSWSVYENKQILKPNSAIVAGHIAYYDALNGEFGACFDHANRPIYDVEGCLVPLTYEEGEETCEVNQIVNAGGALIVNDDGNRLYNFETPSDDARFNKLEIIRFFDLINENMQKSLRKHKHRPVTDVLALAKADVDAFLLKAINSGAAVGAKVWWSEKNNPTEIAAGILYMDYDAGNNVGVRAIIIQPYETSEYYTTEEL